MIAARAKPIQNRLLASVRVPSWVSAMGSWITGKVRRSSSTQRRRSIRFMDKYRQYSSPNQTSAKNTRGSQARRMNGW